MKREYDKISAALDEVRATGYGIVMPAAEEMHLEAPEIVRKGGRYGVRLFWSRTASAPSIALPRQTGTGPLAVSCQRACSRSTPLNRTEGRNANQTQQGRLFHRLLPAPLLKPI